jgi:MraZ protein
MSAEDVGFEGMWHRTLDADSRLRIPAQLRERLANGVVVSMPLSLSNNIEVWPARPYEEYVIADSENITPKNISPDAKKRAEAFFYGTACDRKLDGYGRLSIPGFLREHAGLDRVVTIIGAGDHLEVRRLDA